LCTVDWHFLERWNLLRTLGVKSCIRKSIERR
jgi:hypothetical protein